MRLLIVLMCIVLLILGATELVGWWSFVVVFVLAFIGMIAEVEDR